MNYIIEFEFIVTQNFEEAGLEDSYDYTLSGTDIVLFSERACYIEALSRAAPNGRMQDYDVMTIHQLDAECIRHNIYVNFIY